MAAHRVRHHASAGAVVRQGLAARPEGGQLNTALARRSLASYLPLFFSAARDALSMLRIA
jgi:hypothetical protein